MLIKGVPQKAFNMSETYPSKGNPENIEKLKQLSYSSFGGVRAEVEEEILKKYKKLGSRF
jgi:hypothetical protein